jgi:hypothetical protein
MKRSGSALSPRFAAGFSHVFRETGRSQDFSEGPLRVGYGSSVKVDSQRRGAVVICFGATRCRHSGYRESNGRLQGPTDFRSHGRLPLAAEAGTRPAMRME